MFYLLRVFIDIKSYLIVKTLSYRAPYSFEKVLYVFMHDRNITITMNCDPVCNTLSIIFFININDLG